MRYHDICIVIHHGYSDSLTSFRIIDLISGIVISNKLCIFLIFNLSTILIYFLCNRSIREYFSSKISKEHAILSEGNKLYNCILYFIRIVGIKYCTKLILIHIPYSIIYNTFKYINSSLSPSFRSKRSITKLTIGTILQVYTISRIQINRFCIQIEIGNSRSLGIRTEDDIILLNGSFIYTKSTHQIINILFIYRIIYSKLNLIRGIFCYCIRYIVYYTCRIQTCSGLLQSGGSIIDLNRIEHIVHILRSRRIRSKLNRLIRYTSTIITSNNKRIYGSLRSSLSLLFIIFYRYFSNIFCSKSLFNYFILGLTTSNRSSSPLYSNTTRFYNETSSRIIYCCSTGFFTLQNLFCIFSRYCNTSILSSSFSCSLSLGYSSTHDYICKSSIISYKTTYKQSCTTIYCISGL